MSSPHKFLKARCETTGQCYSLTLEKEGSEYKVVDFAPLDSEKAKVMASSPDVHQDRYQTAKTLLPCEGSSSRVVGHSANPERKGGCRLGMPYRFQCIYCQKLKIDYSKLKRSDFPHLRPGEKISVGQNEEIAICFEDEHPLTDLLVGVGWDESRSSTNMDVDSCVFAFSGNQKAKGFFESDNLVFFHRLQNSNGSIVHHGDNLTGAGQGDDETIDIHLNKLPHNQDKIVIALNIYMAHDRGQTLGSVSNLYITIRDPRTRTALLEYRVAAAQLNPRHNSIVIATVRKSGQMWMFKAVGKSYDVENLWDDFGPTVEREY